MILSIKKSEGEKLKRIRGRPQAIEQDVYQSFYPYTTINQNMVTDNSFYNAIDNLITNSPTAYMPYLCHNNVFHASDKYQQDISKSTIKTSSPYNLKEGIVCACRQIYNANDIPPQRGRYRFYTQAYYIYTALCVGIDKLGNISLLTANKGVLDLLPIFPYNDGVITSPTTDNVNNGIVQCAELTPNTIGYELRQAVVYANKKDYIITPKLWLDYLINGVNNLLNQYPCRVSYINPMGEVISIIAFNNLENTNRKPCRYGVIHCLDVKSNIIVDFPITHFISIEPCEGV